MKPERGSELERELVQLREFNRRLIALLDKFEGTIDWRKQLRKVLLEIAAFAGRDASLLPEMAEALHEAQLYVPTHGGPVCAKPQCLRHHITTLLVKHAAANRL